LDENISNRIKNILNYFTKDIEKKYKSTFIYHGTENAIHTFNEKKMYTTSFFSTTFNLNIGFFYSKLKFIYIFELSENIKFINLNDNLYQIIFSPGTEIEIIGNFKYKNIIFFMCKIIKSPSIDYITNYIEKINIQSKFVINSLNGDFIILYIEDNEEFPNCKRIDYNSIRKIISQKGIQITEIEIKKNIHEEDIPSYFIFNPMQLFNLKIRNCINFNLKFILHQSLLNDIYSYIFSNLTKTRLFLKTKNISTNLSIAWIYDKKYGSCKNFDYSIDLINNYLIDCMMSNWGIFDSNNYIELIDKNLQEPNFKRTLLDGSGLYNLYGHEKSSFSDKEEPFEYYTFLKNSINLKKKIYYNYILIDDMIIHFKNKTVNFKENVKEICKKYRDFIKNNIKHEKTDSIEDEELKNELNNMISKIENVLIYRYNFFNDNMEKIEEQMIECVEEFEGFSSNSISGGERRIPVESRSSGKSHKSSGERRIPVESRRIPVESRISGKSHKSRKHVSSEKVLTIKELNILAKITKNITIMNKSQNTKKSRDRRPIKIQQFMNNSELISKNHFDEIMNKPRIMSKKVIKLDKNKIIKSLNSSELSKEKTY
jgi:hypothetical protein